MKKRFKHSGLHFVAIGFCLFVAQQWLFPSPLPTIGPLSESQVEGLRRQWISAAGELPDAAALEDLIQGELDREMLFREALAVQVHLHDPIVQQRMVRNMRFLGLADEDDEQNVIREALRMELHLGDEAVRRRLIQVMEELLILEYGPITLSEEVVRAEFEARRESLQTPPRLTFQQIYLPADRALEAPVLLSRLRSKDVPLETALSSGSPFPLGYRFVRQSPLQLRGQFGAEFATQLLQADLQPGQWTGPITSAYGSHLIWLEEIEPALDPVFSDVRERLYRELETQQRREVLAAAVADLRTHYEIVL